MDHYQRILLFVSLLCICSGTTSNSNDKTDLLPRSIAELKKYYEVVENLEQRNILTEDQAKKEKQLYIEYGSKLIGKNKFLTTKEFLTSDKRASLISFSNIVAVIAGFIIFIAGLIFTVIFVIPNLTTIPVETWEKLLYFIALSLMFSRENSWFVFLGCLGFFATLFLTFRLGRFGPKIDIGLMSCVLFFSWSIVAIYQKNREVGYLAVAALEVFSSCIIYGGELTASFGSGYHRIMPTVTLSSFFLIMTGIFLHLIPGNFFSILFTRPLLFIGIFLYFIGLIVLSSRLYYKIYRKEDLFNLLQVITFLSGFISTSFGPMFDIPFLQNVGGTMFVLWLLIKYIEIANWTTIESTIISLFGFGILLYVFAYFHKKFFSIFHY